MDLERMLAKCRDQQWKVGDLDWSRPPRPMSKDDEIALVQYFTDMTAIERLAGALFVEQERRVSDPTLRAIFRTFIKDEVRHSQAAQMLADHYDVHRYKTYRLSESLERFFPYFLGAVKYLSDDIANAYITSGELILDIALLRSINDFARDETSDAAMRLINRDESRHIAIDYHMVEFYGSDTYDEIARAKSAAPLAERIAAWWTFANVIYRAKPFFRDVFFVPMERVDPTGRRLREAFRRIQLLGAKPGTQRRPFGRFLQSIQDLYMNPAARRWLGPVLSRLAGVDQTLIGRMNDEAELDRARGASYEQLADEALAEKYA
jgi:rubrerythrin